MKPTSWRARVLFAVMAGVTGVAVCGGAASAEDKRTTPDRAGTRSVPQFNCAVYFNGSQPMAKVTQATATPVASTNDVIVVVTTPGGKVTTSLCGAAFTGPGTGSGVSWNGQTKPGFIYTCSAYQGATTSMCSKHN